MGRPPPVMESWPSSISRGFDGRRSSSTNLGSRLPAAYEDSVFLIPQTVLTNPTLLESVAAWPWRELFVGPNRGCQPKPASALERLERRLRAPIFATFIDRAKGGRRSAWEWPCLLAGWAWHVGLSSPVPVFPQKVSAISMAPVPTLFADRKAIARPRSCFANHPPLPTIQTALRKAPNRKPAEFLARHTEGGLPVEHSSRGSKGPASGE